MKIAVMGAGAVGCYYGGMLQRAGHDVVLIARPQHVDAIQKHGLRMQTQTFDEPVPIGASADAAAIAGAELVLFSVKSNDTDATAALIAPHLSPDALLITLQNSVGNAERLRAAVDNEVSSAVVYVACEMGGPGHVKHQGRGELVIEPTPRAERAAQVLRDAGVPTDLSDNVLGALWAKLVINCAYNALSAIGQMPYGRLVQVADVPAVIRDLVDECRAVAAAEGVALPSDLDEAIGRIPGTMATQYSSTAQDLARGKPSEIDHLNGLVVRLGEAHGIATPVNRALHTLVKVIETARGKAEP